MARIVLKTAKEPFVIKSKEGKEPTLICMCGLSKKQPFCDKSHLATLDEKDDEIYEYDKKGKRVDCCEDDGKEGGCCGGGCCGGGNAQ